MIFDEIQFDELPASKEAAFVDFVSSINAQYKKRVNNDRQQYSDHNGIYEGDYEPERSFVTAVLAFLDEYGIGEEVPDISELSTTDFSKHFGKFMSKVEYLVTRYKIRQSIEKTGGLGTPLKIEDNYRSEVARLLNTIRGIVGNKIENEYKKDRIYKKISDLQKEVDRDKTTVDTLFSSMIDLSQTLGESAENLEPAISKLERIKKIFWDKSQKIEGLPKPERPKLITQETEEENNEEDEIPF